MGYQSCRLLNVWPEESVFLQGGHRLVDCIDYGGQSLGWLQVSQDSGRAGAHQ